MVRFLAFSRRGAGRPLNGDRVVINEKLICNEGEVVGNTQDTLSAVICDGIGGSEGGDLAARLCATGFQLINVEDSSPQSITVKLNDINKLVNEVRRKMPGVNNMATTCTGLLLYKKNYMVFSLGDSRAYRYLIKDRKLQLLTRDHVIQNRYGEEVLNRYIGDDAVVLPDIIRESGIEDSVFLLCTDGFYKEVSEEEMLELLHNSRDFSEVERGMRSLMQSHTFDDDVSVVIVSTGFGKER